MRGFILEVSYTGGSNLRLGLTSPTPEAIRERIAFLLEAQPCAVAILAAWEGKRAARGTWRSGSWRLHRTSMAEARGQEHPK